MEQMDIDNDENDENLSMEQMDVDNSKININVIAGIYGHGGLSSNNKPWIFPQPPENVSLNILGFAPAGFCNIITKQYETEIDKFLTIDPTKITPEILTKKYIELSQDYKSTHDISDREPTLNPTENEELFTYFKNYGKNKKGRTDKIYGGANANEIKNNSRIDGLTMTGPLLKIYYTIIKDEDGNVLALDNNVVAINFNNNIFLSQILKFITNTVESQASKVIGSKPYNIIVDLFDDTCNYTTNPNIAFLDNPRLKNVKVEKGGKTRKHLNKKPKRKHIKTKRKHLKKDKYRKTKHKHIKTTRHLSK